MCYNYYNVPELHQLRDVRPVGANDTDEFGAGIEQDKLDLENFNKEVDVVKTQLCQQILRSKHD